MVAKEFLSDQESRNEESTLLQDPYESEETLSLCDLPIYSDSTSADKWDVFSKEDGESSSSKYRDDDDDEFFEFFSQDFTASTRRIAEKNIVFCGKIIPYREPAHVPQKGRSFHGHPKVQCKGKNGSLNLPYSVNKTKCPSMSVEAFDDGGGFMKKGQEVKVSKEMICGKVSLLRSNTKSRWYLFMFGISRLPNEMELGDIRRRQSRKAAVATTMMSPAAEHGKVVGKRKGKGVWRILRSFGFGCRGEHANDVVKASLC